MDLTPEPSEDQERSDESKLMSFVTKMVGHQRTMAAGLVEVAKGMEAIAAGYEALQLDVEKVREAAYQSGREDAAKANTALLDALRRLRDSWYRQPGWTEAADTVDVLIDAFSEQRAAALVRGQHTTERGSE